MQDIFICNHAAYLIWHKTYNVASYLIYKNLSHMSHQIRHDKNPSLQKGGKSPAKAYIVLSFTSNGDVYTHEWTIFDRDVKQ